jgi:hypothetical protein
MPDPAALLLLHSAVVRAGKRQPLPAEQRGELIDRVGHDRVDAHCALDGLGRRRRPAVARAPAVLQRYNERVTETAQPAV